MVEHGHPEVQKTGQKQGPSTNEMATYEYANASTQPKRQTSSLPSASCALGTQAHLFFDLPSSSIFIWSPYNDRSCFSRAT
mmetsp:Transcript_9975/g.17368  ORF Transcript_9975/g.17368 Transcript_9975/m.17368 type:complete len:81 (+) Transcript_9975:134-376(+)